MRLCTQPSSSEEAMHVWHIESARAHGALKLLQESFLRRDHLPHILKEDALIECLKFFETDIIAAAMTKYISLHVFFYSYYFMRNLLSLSFFAIDK